MSISVRHLSKRFNLYARPLHRFKEWLTLGRRSYHTPFWALRDVSFDLPSGASMGIIGPNGAGKSTILKIITGTLAPTEGEARVEGRVAALLELGTGFHPEFSGRLNIYLNGKMLGLSDDEIAEAMPAIVQFSELGEFIEQPLRTYSSGMAMRLGFSIASCVNPDVLIIDEALSVGDAYFSQKCTRRIREFRDAGVTILFVSHDPSAVLTLCDRAILLEEGQVQRHGSPEEVLDFYNARIAQRSASGPTQILIRDPADRDALGTQRSGNFRVIVAAVDFRNAKGESSEIFTAGQRATLTVKMLFLDAVENPTIGVLFRNRLGIEIFGINTNLLGRRLGRFEAGQVAEASFDFKLNLGPDDYSITVALHQDETHVVTSYDWVDKAWRFRVLPPADFQFYGLARLDMDLTVGDPHPIDVDVGHVLSGIFGAPVDSLDTSPSCNPHFVEGWRSAVDEATRQEVRECAKGARFFLSPATAQIALGCAGPLDASHRPSLGWIGGEAEGRLAEGGDAWLFQIPEGCVGRAQVFELRAGAASPLRVRSIQSS